jgi:hypothetical protein
MLNIEDIVYVKIKFTKKEEKKRIMNHGESKI